MAYGEKPKQICEFAIAVPQEDWVGVVNKVSQLLHEGGVIREMPLEMCHASRP